MSYSSPVLVPFSRTHPYFYFQVNELVPFYSLPGGPTGPIIWAEKAKEYTWIERVGSWNRDICQSPRQMFACRRSEGGANSPNSRRSMADSYRSPFERKVFDARASITRYHTCMHLRVQTSSHLQLLARAAIITSAFTHVCSHYHICIHSRVQPVSHLHLLARAIIIIPAFFHAWNYCHICIYSCMSNLVKSYSFMNATIITSTFIHTCHLKQTGIYSRM